jgi:hypothetical protein
MKPRMRKRCFRMNTCRKHQQLSLRYPLCRTLSSASAVLKSGKLLNAIVKKFYLGGKITVSCDCYSAMYPVGMYKRQHQTFRGEVVKSVIRPVFTNMVLF